MNPYGVTELLSRKGREKEREYMGFFIFVIIVIVIIIEIVLNVGWNIRYFKFGLPIFRRECQGPIISFPVISSYKIETLVQDEQYADLEFRKAQDNFFIFKEKALVDQNG